MLFNKAAVQPPAKAGQSGDKKRKNVKKKNICIFGNYHLLDSPFLSRFFSFFTKTVFCYLPQKSPRATFCHFCSNFALSLLDKILTPLKGQN